MSRNTLYIGNLNYNTTEKDLENLFEKYGKINNIYVVTSGNRPRGYAFIEYETEDEAREALARMNRTEVDEREITVDFSNEGKIVKGSSEFVPRFPSRGRGRGGRGFRRGRGRGRGGFRGGFRGRSRGRGFRGRGGFRGRSRGRGFRGRSRGRGFRRGGGGRFRGGRGYSNRRGSSGYSSRSRRERTNSNLSDTLQTTATLFVANLPFSMEDEGLALLFASLPEFKTAHVVTTSRGRSRGYGFVEFVSEDSQLHALKEMNGKNVPTGNGDDTREIIVKIARAPSDNYDSQDDEERSQESDE